MLQYKKSNSKRTLIFIRQEKNRLPTVARVLSAIVADSTGKIETLGSIFSNETRIREAACVHSYCIWKSNSFQFAGGTSARTFRLVQLIQHDSPVQ